MENINESRFDVRHYLICINLNRIEESSMFWFHQKSTNWRQLGLCVCIVSAPLNWIRIVQIHTESLCALVSVCACVLCFGEILFDIVYFEFRSIRNWKGRITQHYPYTVFVETVIFCMKWLLTQKSTKLKREKKSYHVYMYALQLQLCVLFG